MHRQGAPVVLITGASRGIGLGVSCLLATSGTPLMLTARNNQRLQHVARCLAEQNTLTDAHACDTADEAAMQQAFDKAQRLGSLSAVLNNAGVLEPISPITDIDVEAFEGHLRTNVTGVLVGIKHAFAYRSQRHELRIVNISSGAATHGYRSWAAYCAGKAAVNLLTEVAAAEAPSDVSVVAVAPGIIETRMQRTIRSTSQDRFPDVGKFHQLKETGALLHPVDAAVALVWLLQEAPLQLSGSFLDVRDEAMQLRIPAPSNAQLQQAKDLFEHLESEEVHSNDNTRTRL